MFRKIRYAVVVIVMVINAVCSLQAKAVMADGRCLSPKIAAINAFRKVTSHTGADTEITGDWSGQIETKSGDLVSIRLNIYQAGNNNIGIKLKYGGKRSCMLEGSLEGQLNGAYRFSLQSKGGRYCDKIGQLSLTPQSSASMSYTIIGQNGRIIESGSLTR